VSFVLGLLTPVLSLAAVFLVFFIILGFVPARAQTDRLVLPILFGGTLLGGVPAVIAGLLAKRAGDTSWRPALGIALGAVLAFLCAAIALLALRAAGSH
jgi:hypothetical protein